MNQFDLILLPNVVLLVVALVRHRPGAFILFANQIVVLRALSNIDSFGAPIGMRYLPGALFSSSALGIAAAIFALSTCVAVLTVVLPSRPAVANPSRDLPPLPWWMVWLLGAYFVAYVFSKKTIFTAAYGVDGFQNFSLELAGFSALLQGLVLYELYRRVATGALGRGKAFAFVIGFAVIVHFFKGQTGFAAGFIITAAFLLLTVSEKRVRTSINVVLVVLGCLVAVVLVRGIRAELHTGGLETVDAVVDAASIAEEERTRTGQGLENRTNGTQNAAHILMCIKLHDSGKDRGWRSITSAIAYTFQPSFLQEPLGFERPIDATWELAEHFIHGGGIHLLADLYWNGGYVCVALMMLIISMWIAFCDSRFRSSFWWLMFTCMFAPPSLMGVGYGFNHFARGFFNGCIVVAIVLIARAVLRTSRAARSSPAGAAPVLAPASGTLVTGSTNGDSTHDVARTANVETSAPAASDP